MDLWVSRVTVHGEAMVHAIDAQVAWNATKAEDREKFVRVVGLNDLPNIEDGAFVLVLSTQVV